MKTLIKSIVYGVFACMFISMTAHAQEETVKLRTFKTDFISFQLSNQWNCQMDGTEYVCRPEAKFKKADAIIIIAAKIPGKEDNLKAYMHYLKEPKKITDYKGRPLHSKVSFAKVKPIQATEWVDAIHVSSELKNFYTRYLATVKNGIAILVTYSVARSRHQLYTAELNRMVDSMKVIAKAPQIPKKDRTTASEQEKAKVMVGPKTQDQPESKPMNKVIIHK